MIHSDLMIHLELNHPHRGAETTYDFLSEHLSKYFEKIYMSVTHPYAMVLGVELILQNTTLATSRMFNTLTGQRGLSAMESYCNEAIHFADATVIGHGRQPHKPFWRLEGDAMKRWAPTRSALFTFHEAYWMAFLGRYAYVNNNKVEQLVFEVMEEYKRRLDPDTCLADPLHAFNHVTYDALAGKSLDRYDVLPLDSFMTDHVKKVLERIGR